MAPGGEPAAVTGGAATPDPGLAPGVRLPTLRVRARNLFRDAPNRIHADDEARRRGFAAGLVAGTTVYAYMTRPLVMALGPDWLARGTMRVRLVRPVYDGDALDVRATVVGRSGHAVAGELTVELDVSTPRDGATLTVATGLAGFAWGGPTVAPDPAGYPSAPVPGVRPPATPATLGGLGVLGAPVLETDAPAVRGFPDDVEDPLPLYRGPGAVVHPGLLLQQANRALAENVELGPWLHVESDLAHCGLARVGERLLTRGRVARVFERKGRALVELDLLTLADPDRPVLHVRHTAVYRLDPPGGGGGSC